MHALTKRSIPAPAFAPSGLDFFFFLLRLLFRLFNFFPTTDSAIT
jgi:hypothetical protein